MSATRKPEMSRAQKAIERVHHKIMDMRDSTPMRDGSIEAEENYLKVYKKAYRESQSSTYFAAAERYRLFLQGKPVPGAPLQPGATQPEYEGVSHETEPLDPFKALELICGNRTGTCNLPVNHKGRCTEERLTTLLERMARLVVQEIADNHEPERVETSTKEVYFRCRCGFRYRPDSSFREHLLELLLTESKLQQLREAVERGTGI